MKYTVEEARTILGINEDSSKEDIEKRYNIVLKKYHIAKANGTLDEKTKADFEKCTEAYRIVMGYEVDEPQIEKKETITDKAFEKVGIDKKKAGNFFYYYKFHMLAIVFAIIVITGTVISIVNKENPDITIGLMGELNQDSFNTLKEKVKKNVPEITSLGIDSVVLSNRYQDQYSSANAQKAVILLSASDTEIFLLSKYVYDNYASEGPFMALEDIAKELNIDVSKSDYLKLKVVEEREAPKVGVNERKVLKYRDSEPKLYGIDVTNSKFFKGIDCLGPKKILVVKLEPKNRDLVLKLVKLFTE